MPPEREVSRVQRGAEGALRAASVDGFARTLVQTMRTEADTRTNRIVKHAVLGTVVSTTPVRIQAETHFADGMMFEENDLLFMSGAAVVKGEKVLLVRTVTDTIVVIPVGGTGTVGADGPDAPTDTDEDPPGDGGTTTPISLPNVAGPAGKLVLQKALSYVGTKESPLGSNRGTQVDAWQSQWGMSGQPWCGIFADQMYREAGIDDSGFGHPAVPEIWRRAKAANRLSSTPVPGCFALYGDFTSTGTMTAGHHVTLYIEGPLHNARTVGGNEGGGAVVDQRRNLTPIAGSGAGRCWIFAVPAALESELPEDAPLGTGAPSGNYGRRDGGATMPPITQRRIAFPTTRVTQTAAYSLAHYGESDYVLNPQAVVVHHSAGATLNSRWSTYNGLAADPTYTETPNLSVHFLVDTEGRVYQLMELNVRARHTEGMNHVALGVEFIGANAAAVLANAPQISSGLRLIRWLQSRFNITTGNVIGHAENLDSDLHEDLIYPTATGTDFITSEANQVRAEL
jgi:hypothetical protein